MFAVEWLSWLGCVQSDNKFAKMVGNQEWRKLQTEYADGGLREYADDLAEKKAKMAAERFETAHIEGPVYACNDVYLEVRCGALEKWRGFITLVSLTLLWTIFKFADSALHDVLREIESDWVDFDFGSVLLFITSIGPTVGFSYVFYKYVFKFTRLECFTYRHLLIRFNRVTRQVYLHRPAHCGGIVTMPWEGIMHDDPGSFPMMVSWQEQNGDNSFPLTMAFIGKSYSKPNTAKEQWEFIRRYMDEGGLQAVKAPEIASRLPFPWTGLCVLHEGLENFFENSNGLIIAGVIVLFPALIIVSLLHWVSLLLCWPPRWPKEIREAGQPGKPTPKLTTIDDYPPKIATQLKANAYRWKPHPGRKPVESKENPPIPRKSQKARKES
jgi:hypothetical protein